MSDDLAEATTLDAEDRPLAAAAAYERAIASGEGNLETYQDLLAIYLSCQDMGYLAHHRLPDSFVQEAARRYSELIEAAEARFGPSDAVDFWRRYYRWRVLGDHDNETPALMKIYERGNVPEACVAVVDTDRKRMLQRLRLLYELCRDGTTERKRDFRSLAASGLRLEGERPEEPQPTR